MTMGIKQDGVGVTYEGCIHIGRARQHLSIYSRNGSLTCYCVYWLTPALTLQDAQARQGLVLEEVQRQASAMGAAAMAMPGTCFC